MRENRAIQRTANSQKLRKLREAVKRIDDEEDEKGLV